MTSRFPTMQAVALPLILLLGLGQAGSGWAQSKAAATDPEYAQGSSHKTHLGVSSNNYSTMPAWLSSSPQMDQDNLNIYGEKGIGREGWVRIGGGVARGRSNPATGSGSPANQWDGKSLSVGGGYGSFGASITNRVIDAPGGTSWEGYGLGLTWRTPWSGQLTVGAENVVTRGKNPFAPGSDEGSVPYVRYEQDL